MRLLNVIRGRTTNYLFGACRLELQLAKQMFTRYKARRNRSKQETLEVTMKHRNVGIASVALVTCLSLAVGGCGGGTQLLQGESGQQVTVKTSDQTPPSGITIETQGRAGGDITLGRGAPPLAINIGRGDSFFLRAVAEDSEGIKEVSILGTTEKVCEDSATGAAQHVGPGQKAPLVKDMSSATVGGTASSVRYVSYVVKVDISCSPTTLRFVSQKFVFWGEAENFSNRRSTSPSLTVTAK